MIFFVFYLLLSGAPAQLPPAERPEAWVLVVDPGASLFTRFGHSAFLFRAPGAPDEVYDFGHFEFSPRFLRDFLHGRALYSIDSSELEDFLENYAEEQREVRALRLALPAEQVQDMREILQKILASPEREYLYQHFADNCTTRMRDLISQITYGKWRRLLSARPGITWRRALFDVLGGNMLLKHALSLLLSVPMDRPRSAWDGTYLPAQLERELMATRGMGNNPDAPFVDLRIVLSLGIRHDRVSVLPPWSFALLAVMLAFLTLPLVFFDSRLWLHLAFLVVALLQSVVFLLLLFLHFYHEICAFNLNLITFVPLLFIFFPLWLGSGITARRSVILVLASALFPSLVMVLRPWTLQQTAPFPEILLGLHLLLLAEIALWRLQNRPQKPAAAPSAPTPVSG